MKDIQVGYEGPPKYLNQRDAPLEIPSDVIKAFFRAADVNANERLSIDELFAYAEKHKLPFTKDEITNMFVDATKNRAVVLEKHRNDPLTQDEVISAVRGRHRWNTQTKEWEVAYRPTRDQWIIMLQTVSERLFAMPVPKVVPTKIRA
jgi:hypothetical protein